MEFFPVGSEEDREHSEILLNEESLCKKENGKCGFVGAVIFMNSSP